MTFFDDGVIRYIGGHGPPTRQTRNSIGIDLCYTGDISAPGDFFTILPGEIALVPTGVIWSASGDQNEHVALILPRSGLMKPDKKLIIPNAPGLIDPDFPSEWMIKVTNIGEDIVRLVPGDRLAQAVIIPKNMFILAGSLLDRTRIGGFGSTDEV